MKRAVLIGWLAAVAAMTGCAAESGGTSSTEEGIAAETEETAKREVEGERAAAAPVSAPTFDEVQPILVATCGSCHRATMFSTIDKVRTIREEMLRRISEGVMPRDNPTWRDTADGQTVLAFLRSSPELATQRN